MEEKKNFLLQAIGIKKSFGSIIALEEVNLEIGHNEIVGLVGDNGAGKSTLIKILTGVYSADRGELYWKGQKIDKLTVNLARGLGIVTVFQDRALVSQHPIWRNVFMGKELANRFGFINIRKEKEETMRLLKEMMGFTSASISSPDTIVGNMSGGEQQGIAISRALYFEAPLIILDEPTTGLSLTESQKVINFVRNIKKEKKSCIFITHNLFHVYPVADRIVIIDRGKIVEDLIKDKITLKELEERMIKVTGTNAMRAKNADKFLLNN
ncbi:MAG: sugar ABC transporter ATP-binding protein [Actinobacteria bacterium]|nr:sugar ABC transporter ATP-binding protein [Actinomycetota bacterium]